MQLHDLTQLIFQTLQGNSDHYEEITSPEPNQIRFVTMEEEPTIIHDLYAVASTHDCDIMDFTMHSRMIQDEDENFITTITFTFHQIDN